MTFSRINLVLLSCSLNFFSFWFGDRALGNSATQTLYVRIQGQDPWQTPAFWHQQQDFCSNLAQGFLIRRGLLAYGIFEQVLCSWQPPYVFESRDSSLTINVSHERISFVLVDRRFSSAAGSAEVLLDNGPTQGQRIIEASSLKLVAFLLLNQLKFPIAWQPKTTFETLPLNEFPTNLASQQLSVYFQESKGAWKFHSNLELEPEMASYRTTKALVPGTSYLLTNSEDTKLQCAWAWERLKTHLAEPVKQDNRPINVKLSSSWAFAKVKGPSENAKTHEVQVDLPRCLGEACWVGLLVSPSSEGTINGMKSKLSLTASDFGVQWKLPLSATKLKARLSLANYSLSIQLGSEDQSLSLTDLNALAFRFGLLWLKAKGVIEQGFLVTSTAPIEIDEESSKVFSQLLQYHLALDSKMWGLSNKFGMFLQWQDYSVHRRPSQRENATQIVDQLFWSQSQIGVFTSFSL